MDYRRFLAKSEEVVLPYLGGGSVETGTRRLRVVGAPSPGFVRFRIEGRRATALGEAEAPDLGALPSRTGHFVAGYLASADGSLARLHLVPSDEPLALSPVRGRVWHDGAVIFAEGLFETDAEETARRRLELEEALGDEKGIASSLRAAFAAALAIRVGRRLAVDVSPTEVRGATRAISAAGRAAAEVEVRRIEARRAEAARASEEQAAGSRLAAIARRSLAGGAQRRGTIEDAEARAAAALGAASGRLLSSRRLDGDRLEVRYEIFGERFITIVDALTLHVVDAGVCLDGSDEEVTLESLPSVLREAIDTGALVITRR